MTLPVKTTRRIGGEMYFLVSIFKTYNTSDEEHDQKIFEAKESLPGHTFRTVEVATGTALYAQKISYEKIISGCFFFLNRSLISRSHPSRPYKHSKSSNEYYEATCNSCGEWGMVNRYSTPFGEMWTCPKCRMAMHDLENKNARKIRRFTSKRKIEEYKSFLKTCEHKGVCPTLAAHHVVLAEDDQRLTTKFMIDLICKRDYTPGAGTKESDKMRKELLEKTSLLQEE